MNKEFGQTEREYRTSVSKVEFDANAKKAEAKKAKEISQELEKEAGRLTDLSTKFEEAAESLKTLAQANQ